ncbi:MAG: hypothetical protein FIB06_03035 [Betaproteobacteria bacterium]|nr:hypothetical protein [Betaproteobacteria bacterium]
MNALPADPLAPQLPAEQQRLAARMAQDAFVALFRLGMDESTQTTAGALADVESRCRNWCAAATGESGPALRTALMVSALDQWGVAYAQAFALAAMPALSALLGSLRGALDATDDARFQQYYEILDSDEGAAMDFKIDVRRNIHLALWHASVACAGDDEADPVIAALGSQLVATAGQMPELGWRLVADALAGIQIRLLSEPGSEAAGERTRRLFEALRGHLPEETWRTILAHSTRAVLDWQQARRQAH